MLTPSEWHHGRGQEVLMARPATMLRAFAANPRRFHGQEPKLQELPKEVWINRPVKEEVRLMMSSVV